jgi:hypothetical protein
MSPWGRPTRSIYLIQTFAMTKINQVNILNIDIWLMCILSMLTCLMFGMVKCVY